MKSNDYRPLVPVDPRGLDEVAEGLLNSTPPASGSNSSNSALLFQNARINPLEYIQVGINGIHGKPVVISCYELQGSNSKNYESANKFVLTQGLYVPTPLIFMTHFMNVVEAKKGNKQLTYSDGSLVGNNETDEIYKHLTTNYKDVFGSNNPGAWAWLNARFVAGTGDNNLDLETITGVRTDGTFITKKEPLENKIWEDCFIDIVFNRQGLAKAKSGNQAYVQGNNIKFYHPKNNAVARFGASSGRASLYCYWNPTGSDARLGVFACAEGATPQNGGSQQI